ncbi:putative damage-inducible protein DinB [Peribacillus deserti]|uniref:Damage-inducible protein DinB n=1 Tax=Peribacillus deserti TaxID=673318 RepID=A0ABS2QMS0_9BACI|nr:DinB family protein [Peribacillus deserti]MBM7694255.1 putative damage-inducible protein DinB [Peribacillus deserti]
MKPAELIVLNFEEIRRRSIKVWRSIPTDYLDWKPDEEAMTCLEMVRHVLDSEHYYHLAILNRGSLEHYDSPFDKQPIVSIEQEITLSEPLRASFIEMAGSLTAEDLSHILIDRSDSGYIRTLGDMLLRVGYHESIHTGQLLDYLRTAGVHRVNIWD